MKYPRGVDNNWVPRIIANLEVKNIKVGKYINFSKKGFKYRMCQAQISDEDATYLELAKDPDVNRLIKISSNPFNLDK